MTQRNQDNMEPFRADAPAGSAALPWQLGLAQDIGARREQQDCIGTVTGSFRGRPALLAVLADGMGGMQDGARFSRIAVSCHQENFQRALDSAAQPAAALLSLALQANEQAHRIYDETRPGGTTLVTALFLEDCFYTLCIGDSRICLYRKTGRGYASLQINREHVFGPLLDEQAWMGRISFADAENNLLRSSLTSAVGDSRIRAIDLTEHATRFLAGDRLALMSDGVYRSLSEEKLCTDMAEEPHRAAEEIIRQVRGRKLPHQDNMSIIIVGRV